MIDVESTKCTFSILLILENNMVNYLEIMFEMLVRNYVWNIGEFEAEKCQNLEKNFLLENSGFSTSNVKDQILVMIRFSCVTCVLVRFCWILGTKIEAFWFGIMMFDYLDD